MLRKGLNLAVIASLIAVAAGLGWIVYGEMSTSEAAHFDTSLILARNQSQNMSATLNDAGVFVGTEIAQITSISALLAQWTPRYGRALSAYSKLYASIIAAEKRAEAYFAAQRALTTRYYDPQRHAQAKARDEADHARYTQWREQARSARAQASRIVIRLTDMDTDFQKLELASEFSFDASGFNAVPADILSNIRTLDGELSQFQVALTQFQIASDDIQQITASPFGAN